MGLAASQARLLSITARMHDVELEAEHIMMKKTALATQQDALYEEYCNALDAKKLKVAFNGEAGSLNYVDATFATVCGYNENRKYTYALTTADSGEMVVDDEVYEKYQEFENCDKYAFAFAMLGFMPDDCCTLEHIEDGTYDSSIIGLSNGIIFTEDDNPGDLKEFYGSFKDETTGEMVYYLLMSDAEAQVYNLNKDTLSDELKKFNEVVNKNGGTVDKAEVQKALDSFRTKLYNTCSKEIFANMVDISKNNPVGEFDNNEFNYYAKLFEGIKAAGGCVPISKYANGESTNNDWFNNVIKTGELLLNKYNTGAHSGWQTITADTCTDFQEVSDDVAIKKAEAKYQNELRKISDKDKKYDRDLKNLETERTALDKQRESIEKVKDDNIERTFGIFS